MWWKNEKRAYGSVVLMLILSITLGSCRANDDEQPVEIREFPGVQEELWPYFIRFEDEGRARGVTIDLATTGITAIIEQIQEDNVAGVCHFNPRTPNDLVIDEAFWVRASDLFKEFVVFHELGHCFLFRDHKEDQFTNGTCVSLMRSGNGDCRDNYNTASRFGYLDELFDPEFRNDIFGN